MFAIVAALAAIYLLAAGAHAQTSNGTGERRYVVWSSVIFTRTGERTPEILGKIPTQLTSVGAQQAYAAGQFFRNRYTILRNGSNGAESAGAELIGLSDVLYDQNQVVSMALEQQYNLATQQAFMQGLYPPTSLGNSSTTGGQFNGMNSLANGSYVSNVENISAMWEVLTETGLYATERLPIHAAQVCWSSRRGLRVPLREPQLSSMG